MQDVVHYVLLLYMFTSQDVDSFAPAYISRWAVASHGFWSCRAHSSLPTLHDLLLVDMLERWCDALLQRVEKGQRSVRGMLE